MTKRETLKSVVVCVSLATVLLYAFIILRYTGKLENNLSSVNTNKNNNLRPKAAVFTPYHITPGGGERYLLSSVLVLQDLGYHVQLMVDHKTSVTTIPQLNVTAQALRIKLNYDQLTFIPVVLGVDDVLYFLNKMVVPREFEVFYLLGNSKLPFVYPLGRKFNMYMCQFPFDMAGPIHEPHYQIVQQYDSIILNSQYTHKWYSKYSENVYKRLLDEGRPMPTVSIVFPPVEPFTTPYQGAQKNQLIPFHRRDPKDYFNIVMLGRFFRGRQSKGHFAALRIFQRVRAQAPKNMVNRIRLFMIGKIQPEEEHQNYTAEVKGNASALGLPVVFLNNAPPEQIDSVLRKSHVYWHLTGIDVIAQESTDPASLEHFGISVVEAMSTGCIPIVLSVGGTTDIVAHGVNGYWANSETDFVKYTLNITREFRILRKEGVASPLRRNPDIPVVGHRLQAFSEESVRRSKKFHLDVFRKTLYQLIQRGVLSHQFRTTMNSLLPKLAHRHLTVKKDANVSAMIVAANIDGAFRSVVFNVMEHLSVDWGLVVVHSADSEEYVKYCLRNVENVKFLPLKDSHSITSIADYNELVFSVEFWKMVNMWKVLLFQTDSVILRSGIDEFLKYDFVGAPWDLEQNDRVKKLRKEGKLKSGVGNGGFSLRKVDAMIRISQSVVNNDNIPQQQEDLFFVQKFEEFGYRIAPQSVAYDFAVEVPIRSIKADFVKHNPFALHAAWYYWPKDDLDRWFKMLLL